MSLSPGTRLGPYEVVAKIGEGGMGEVYRATDLHLKRQVALKVLPASVAGDAERLARFQREAEVLAALNHPNIAAIYGLEKTPDVTALVMELVEGEDLSAHIARGPMPIGEVLAIARQIAEALEAAHERGIIHRDLKPQNIKVREDGAVKVLDFGLAKAIDQDLKTSRPQALGDLGDLADSPTITTPAMTMRGMILGTAAYMSPEQARARALDKRTDVWAFGCVLYEMLAGRRAFEGEDATETISAVMKSEPDWTALPASVPAHVRAIVMRCLAKDRKARVPDVSVVRFALDGSLNGDQAGADAPAPTRPWVRALPWAVAAVAIVVATWSLWRPATDTPAPVIYSTIDGPEGYVIGEADPFLDLPSRTPMTFTADGRGLIILASVGPTPSALAPSRTRLFFRALDRPDLRPIPGTEGALAPFVSPDGKWIGFWASNELRKVPIEGGTPVTICPLLTASLGPFGAAWGPGDTIVFGDVPSGRIMRVSANGGTPVAVTAQPPVSSRRRHIAPVFLPDGRRILYSDTSTQDAADSRIMAQSLDGGTPALVVEQATDGRLLPTGQLAFIRLATLMTVPFDAGRAVALGDPSAVLTNVMQGGTIRRRGVSNPGMAMFAVSSLGTLVAIRGGVAGVAENRLTWNDARGQASAEPAQGAPQGRRMNTRISPDGARALVTVFTPRRQEMWVADWTRNVWTTCNTCDTELGVAIWSPDSHRLLLGRDGTLIEHALDGSAPDTVLWREADRSVLPVAWLSDGRIAYMSSPNLTDYEVRMVVPGATASQEVLPLGASLQAAVSPDGRWVAYTEVKRRGEDPNFSRDSNVIVQAFPGPGVRLQVSAGGANGPVWSRDSRTVYFSGADESLYAVDISSAGGLSAGRPRRVMPAFGSCFPSRCSDVADGPRFLGPAEPASPPASVTRMDLVLNWTSTLPAGR